MLKDKILKDGIMSFLIGFKGSEEYALSENSFIWIELVSKSKARNNCYSYVSTLSCLTLNLLLVWLAFEQSHWILRLVKEGGAKGSQRSLPIDKFLKTLLSFYDDFPRRWLRLCSETRLSFPQDTPSLLSISKNSDALITSFRSYSQRFQSANA